MNNQIFRLLLLLSMLLMIELSFADSYSPPDNYYSGCQDLKGEELKSALHNIIKDHIVFPYFSDNDTGSSEMMEVLDIDPDNFDNIICFYSGFSYPKNWIDKGDKKDYQALGTTHDNSWNREHVWSKSHGFPDMNADVAYSDIHNLRPEDSTVNTDKGAKDFDWGGFSEQEVRNCYTDTDSWEAPDRVKGDIARCIFYMATRYEGTDTPYDLEIVDYTNTEGELYGRLSTLLEWHKLDPPDDYERRRNQIIFTDYQHNRNPYIDHPEYAFLIWGEPQYSSRLTFSQDVIYFNAVENDPVSYQIFNLTAVNQTGNLTLNIEEYLDIFFFDENQFNLEFSPDNNYINQQVKLNFSPATPGEFKSSILFSGFDQEIALEAFILPINGAWLINEEFSESLGVFTQNVLQGNPRYGWHLSSWDADTFARVRGNHDEFDLRECWLISPPLNLDNFTRIFLNFRTARNSLKTDQVSAFFATELPVDGIPASAIKIDAQYSQGNYNWQNSSWLQFNKTELPGSSVIYLLFRYYYDGDPKGQETWELDNIKLYGEY